MNLSYLTEAFKSLDILNEDEEFDLTDKKDLNQLKEIVDEDPTDTIEIMSMDFDETEDDFEDEEFDTHVGDVILDCPVCHSKIYKNHEEVNLDEDEEFANVGEECPYCYTADGFKIVGQVAPYKPEDEVKVEIEDKVDDDEFEEEEKVEVEESLKESKDVDLTEYQKWVDYDMKKYHKISNVTMNKIKKAGLSVVKDQYGDYEVIADRADSDANESLKMTEDFEDLKKYQKLVDQDMRKYHKISKNTMDELKSAGVSVYWPSLVKDQYDDYEVEVLNDRKDSDANESCGRKSKRKQSKLTEKKWDYTLKSGSALRDAIEEEDYEGVKDSLMDCYSELFNAGIIDEDDYDSWTSDITMIDVDDEDAEDQLDYQLDEFYDLCDNLNIWVSLSESLKNNKKVHEGFEKVELETDDQKITVKSEPREESSDEFMIKPIETEMKDEIEVQDDEDESEEDEEIDFDVNEFDEESFDEIGESYLKNVYENVNSYKTSNVWQTENKLIVEGMIKFNSGKEKRTQFIFESKDATKSGKIRFIGENTQISRGKKSFLLKGSLNSGKFLSESLNYNYRTKDTSGKSSRVYGTVKVQESKKLSEKELSQVEGSASNAVVKWWKDYDFSNKSVNEIKKDLLNIIPEDRKNEPKVKELIRNIEKAKTNQKAAIAIGNFVLKGDNQGTVK